MSTAATVPDEVDQSGRHPVNIVHLVMGLIFLGLLAVWSVVQSEVFSAADLRWLLPLPLLVAGAAGLTAVGLSGRRRTLPSSPTAESGIDHGLTDEDVSLDELVNDNTEEMR